MSEIDDMEDCGCVRYCPQCGRDNIQVDDEGEYCGDCGPDWGDELCMPMAHSCDMLNNSANEFERQFMCDKHKAEHIKFCEEVYSDDHRQESRDE